MASPEGAPLHKTAITSEEWMQKGACRPYPPEAFFPHDGVGVDAARKICGKCAVQLTCLEYALANKIEHGVWGGCSERERRRILRRRRQQGLTSD